MSRSITTVSLRVAQGLLAGTSLGLSAYVINWYHHRRRSHEAPTSVDFLLFASIFSVLSTVYLEVTPRFAPRFAHPFATLGVEGLNATFFLAGFAAFAAHISGLTFCRGHVCHVSQADVVIGAGAFCAWAASAILAAKDIIVVRLHARRKAKELNKVSFDA